MLKQELPPQIFCRPSWTIVSMCQDSFIGSTPNSAKLQTWHQVLRTIVVSTIEVSHTMTKKEDALLFFRRKAVVPGQRMMTQSDFSTNQKRCSLISQEGRKKTDAPRDSDMP